MVFLKADGEFLVGEAAERRGLTEPDRLAREFKRRIGDHVPIMVAGAPFSPQALTAQLLRWVVDRASERMGGPPDEVVLTYPANWGPFRLELLDQVAGDGRAGVRPPVHRAGGGRRPVRRPEPGRRPATRWRSTTWAAGRSTPACWRRPTPGSAPSAPPRAWSTWAAWTSTRRCCGTCWPRSPEPPLDPDDPEVTVGLARLRRDCVEAKEALSTDVDTLVPVALPGLSTTVRLTRAEFELMVRLALNETMAAMGRALRNAQRRAERSCAASCWSAAAPGSRWSARCCTGSSRCPPPWTATPSTTWPWAPYAWATTRPTPSPG